jgi:hypothetical protein
MTNSTIEKLLIERDKIWRLNDELINMFDKLSFDKEVYRRVSSAICLLNAAKEILVDSSNEFSNTKKWIEKFNEESSRI